MTSSTNSSSLASSTIQRASGQKHAKTAKVVVLLGGDHVCLGMALMWAVEWEQQ